MINKSLFYILLLFCFSCAEMEIRKVPSYDRLSELMTETFSNLSNASDSIASKNLIKNLSHLNRMNYGGSHYYPLEREAITDIIKSLSSSDFSECILMNAEGKIIYTMKDDEILGKSYMSFASSPLPSLFSKAITGEQSIFDFSIFPSSTTDPAVFFAVPVKDQEKIIGVLIASVSSEKIKDSVSNLVMITDRDNIIRYHNNNTLFMKKASEADEFSFASKSFEYKEIFWNIYIK